MAQGRQDFGRNLIARGFVHDHSKFFGIEWDYLHVGPDVPDDKLQLAIKQHTRVNDHHAEFHGGAHNMPEIAVAEMVCDWFARSQEFATDLREWITEVAVPKYDLLRAEQQYEWINGFVDLLLENSFQNA